MPAAYFPLDGFVERSRTPIGQAINFTLHALHRSNYCVTCERTPSGRIRRSSSARHAFREMHPCPATGSTAGPCPGYVVDHIVPLKCGGADSPENMQWQSRDEAKAKDRVE